MLFHLPINWMRASGILVCLAMVATPMQKLWVLYFQVLICSLVSKPLREVQRYWCVRYFPSSRMKRKRSHTQEKVNGLLFYLALHGPCGNHTEEGKGEDV